MKHEDVTQLIETDEEFAKEGEWLEESLEIFIRLEIHAKEYTDQCLATGTKSNESVDVVLNSNSVMSAHEGNGESLNHSGMSGMQSSGQTALTPPRTMVRLLKTVEMMRRFQAEHVVLKWKSRKCRSSIEM